MSEVAIVIKNPAVSSDFNVSLPEDHTVNDLKQHLERHYPGNPPTARQKLIYYGTILNDQNSLASYAVSK